MKMIVSTILAFSLVRASSRITFREIKEAKNYLLAFPGFKDGEYYEDTLDISINELKTGKLKELEETFLQGKKVVSPIFSRVEITMEPFIPMFWPYSLNPPKIKSFFTKNELADYLVHMQILLRFIADKIKPLELRISNDRGLDMSWDTLNKMLQNTETRYCTSSDWELEELYIDNSNSFGPENSSISTPLYWCILNSLKIKAVGKLSLYENIGSTAFACEFIRLLQVDKIEKVYIVLTGGKNPQNILKGDIMNVSSHKLLKNATEANLNKIVETLKIGFWPLNVNIGTEWTRGSDPFGSLNELSIKHTNITIPFVLYSAMVQNKIKIHPATSFTFEIFGPSDFLSIYNELFEKNSKEYRNEKTKNIKIAFLWEYDRMEDAANRSLIKLEIKPLEKILQWISMFYPKATSLSIKEGKDKINILKYPENPWVSQFYLFSKTTILQSLIRLLVTSKITISGLSEDIELNEITFAIFDYCKPPKYTNTVTNIEKKKGGEFHVGYTYEDN